MIHTLPWTFEEIGKGENKSLQVAFECHVSPGSPGSYWEPPDPPEIEFADVEIIAFTNGDGEVVAGASWQPSLRQIAFDLAESERDRLFESLSERVRDYELADWEDFHERKRDYLRGC